MVCVICFFFLFLNYFSMLFHFYHEKKECVGVGRLSQGTSSQTLCSLGGKLLSLEKTVIASGWGPNVSAQGTGEVEGGREGGGDLSRLAGRFVLTQAGVDTTRAASGLCRLKRRRSSQERSPGSGLGTAGRTPAESSVRLVPPGLPLGSRDYSQRVG